MAASIISMSRIWGAAVAVVAAFAMVVDIAEARPGRGGSFGSRGVRTFSPPPPTNTAPRQAQPIDKSMTRPGTSATASKGAGATAAGAAQASRFGGMRGLLMGGLFAAALAGIFGVGALASILGFMLQVLLVGGIVWLLLNWLRARSAMPQAAGPGGRGTARSRESDPMGEQRRTAAGGGLGARMVHGLDSTGAPVLRDDDFDAFERRLGEIQSAYGRSDIKALEPMLTPEMLSYFSAELADNARRGIRNEVSGAKLLQGDLAETWREQGEEYASVALRYSILDAEVDIASGRVVSGSRSEPSEVTEIWTFRRPRGATSLDWELSAIQQA